MKNTDKSELVRFLQAAEDSLGNAGAVCDASGIARRTYNNWIHGTGPGIFSIVAIAKAADLSLDAFFTGPLRGGDVGGIPGDHVLRCLKAVEDYTVKKGLYFTSIDRKIAAVRALAETSYDPASLEDPVEFNGDQEIWIQALTSSQEAT